MSVALSLRASGGLEFVGKGDGTTTAFKLFRPGSSPELYRDDWQGLTLLSASARTNLLSYSEQVDNAAWTKSGTTVSANSAVGPNGASTLDKLVETTTTAEHRATRTFTATAGTRYTISVVAKAAERGKLAIQTNLTGSWLLPLFDLTTATVAFVPAGFMAGIIALPNGTYRCWASAVADTSASKSVLLNMADASGAVSYLGVAASGLHIGMAQVEAGSLTAYMGPSSGSALTVTDYSVSGSTATMAVAPVAGSTISRKRRNSLGVAI